MGESILDKYVGRYFEHYLVCTNYEISEEGFYQLADLYLRIEGKDTLHKLIDEINLIDANEDWDAFVLHLKRYESNINRATIQRIASVAKCVFESVK